MVYNRGRIEREVINNSLVYTDREMTLSNAGHFDNKSVESFVRAYLGEAEL